MTSPVPAVGPEEKETRTEMGTTGAYSLDVWEGPRHTTSERLVDPFHNTTIRVRGWRNALRVLLRRYEVNVMVGGDRDRMERVLELDPDYLGPAGSPSRNAWNAQLNAALRDFA